MTHLASLSHSLTLLRISSCSVHTNAPAVDRQAPLGHLILALFQVGNELWSSALPQGPALAEALARRLTLSQLSEIFPLEQVVRLEEDFSETGRPSWVVPIIEPIETVKLLMRVHVQRVDGKIVCSQVERLEHLLEGQVLAVTVNDNLLPVS